ncbi:MAG: ATP-binding cassette domain-containing protein [Bacteroidetes bacterium]|nr:MAG: ATP-binding cassette domain-containing protein [Bacteroidota bacterium]
MLQVTGLRKEYSTVVAVENVSLTVNRGEIFGLIGPNGAGKTTTIRMILNIITPDQGSVFIDGKPYSEQTRNIVGYLPEERGLYRKNKVIHTIIYFATLRGVPVQEARRRAYEWLKRFELLEKAEGKVEELSKGNQQKVQFINSIIHDPQLVILDEPFSGLDPVNQILLKDILMELKDAGKAIIFSTHVMEQAEKLCEKICLINRGNVILDGRLQDVKKRFGNNSVHIEYTGDGAFLSSLPNVKRAMLYENYAELELSDDAPTGELVRALSQRLELRKFELVEPSLHSIFLSMVGGDTVAPKEVKQ